MVIRAGVGWETYWKPEGKQEEMGFLFNEQKTLGWQKIVKYPIV